MHDNTARTERYLTFRMAEELYGLEIARVREMIAPMPTTPVPGTPEFLKGVINLRGTIIPVVDLRLKFKMPEHPADVNTAVIIYEVDKRSVGFIVDRLEDVLPITAGQIIDPPRFGSGIDTAFIEKVAELASGVVLILNLERIFDPEELLEITMLEKTGPEKYDGDDA